MQRVFQLNNDKWIVNLRISVHFVLLWVCLKLRILMVIGWKELLGLGLGLALVLGLLTIRSKDPRSRSIWLDLVW